MVSDTVGIAGLSQDQRIMQSSPLSRDANSILASSSASRNSTLRRDWINIQWTNTLTWEAIVVKSVQKTLNLRFGSIEGLYGATGSIMKKQQNAFGRLLPEGTV